MFFDSVSCFVHLDAIYVPGGLRHLLIIKGHSSFKSRRLSMYADHNYGSEIWILEWNKKSDSGVNQSVQ